MEPLRQAWAAGRTTLGVWLSVPSSVTAEVAARAGPDYVCVDTQHGAIGYQVAVGMIQAIALGGSTPIARAAWNQPGEIGKLLDAGALGVIVPMVNSADEAAAVVRACRYAPLGTRSFGPLMAGLRSATYAAEANDTVAAIPMIETVEALANLDDILAVPGIDAVYVGPADLSLSLGLPPGNNDDRAEFTQALETIVAGCRKAGVVAGIHSTGALAPRRLEQGFTMVTVTADLLSMRTRIAEELDGVRSARRPPESSPTAMY